MKKRSIYDKYVKRAFDILFALIAFIIVLPVFLICVIAIKLEDPKGSVFFSQKRNGKNGAVFTIYKLRTMKSEMCGRQIHPSPDTLTRTGKIIRKLSLDEIPQFYNILRGEMSLIGPRPLLLSYYEWYNETERRRFNVRPGITGLSQINGRANLNWDERFALDVRYADNVSFILDLKIFLKSFFVVFSHKDVIPDDDNAIERFDIYRSAQLQKSAPVPRETAVRARGGSGVKSAVVCDLKTGRRSRML